MPTDPLFSTPNPSYVQPATPPDTGQKRGPVPRRRYQKGCFIKQKDGGMYCQHYVDGPDGTKQVKQFIGNLGQMSERAAKREHALIMEKVNRDRGSLAPIIRGQSFVEAVEKWRVAIAPNLARGTVRQRESYLRNHIMPRFGK